MNEYNMDQEIQIEGLTEKEVKELSDIIKRFVNSYIKKDKSMTDDEWLYEKLKEELPKKDDNEIKKVLKFYNKVDNHENLLANI